MKNNYPTFKYDYRNTHPSASIDILGFKVIHVHVRISQAVVMTVISIGFIWIVFSTDLYTLKGSLLRGVGTHPTITTGLGPLRSGSRLWLGISQIGRPKNWPKIVVLKKSPIFSLNAQFSH